MAQAARPAADENAAGASVLGSLLRSLSIRHVVLIEHLDLHFRGGLCVLTGETGAGKSILLDSLGLALGARADSGLVMAGQDRAAVTATFEVTRDHPALALLAENELDSEDGELVLRRSVSKDGRSRAFVNDQPVSVTLLRTLGDLLVEVHGQFETRGLLDPATHRGLLDAFAGTGALVDRTATAWHDWQHARRVLEEAKAATEQARRDEAFLRDAVEELEKLAPKPGEEAQLAEQRTFLMSRERLVNAVRAAQEELSAGRGVDSALRSAQRGLERVAGEAAGLLDEVLAAIDRAAIEAEESLAQLEAAASRIEIEGPPLEEVDDRLFALRDAARKHDVAPDELPALMEELAQRLAGLDDEAGRLAKLEKAVASSRATYLKAAEALSTRRKAAAEELDRAVAGELPALKLDRARIRSSLTRLDEGQWGPGGIDGVQFEVATNAGSGFGSLARVASGGELARFMLAFKVVLTRSEATGTLVFDEVDAGIGGATASAVGERLARLAQNVQVLVVTHSPQVAAKADQHCIVRKSSKDDQATRTHVEEVDGDGKLEEIARMLSGARVTEAARAAAESLLNDTSA